MIRSWICGSLVMSFASSVSGLPSPCGINIVYEWVKVSILSFSVFLSSDSYVREKNVVAKKGPMSH